MTTRENTKSESPSIVEAPMVINFFVISIKHSMNAISNRLGYTLPILFSMHKEISSYVFMKS